jgi:glucose/arabinose dehydrogenase
VTTVKYTALMQRSIPKDNPFVGVANAKEAIYTYGNRNPQGMTKHPHRGYLGTRTRTASGDEINIVKKGANYGWPVATYGIDYDNTIISNIQQKKVQDPEYYWAPPSLRVEWHL